MDPQAIKAIAVCTFFALAVLAGVIMAMLDHQRKMAEILRSDRNQAGGLDERMEDLQNEVRELKAMLSNQLPSRATIPTEQQRVL